MILSSAYLLVSHGSRDPRPQQAMDKLAKLVHAQLGSQNPTLRERLRRTGAPPCLGRRFPNPARSKVPIPTGRTMVLSNAWYPLVGTATLELGYAPLHEQIRQFASIALAGGCNHLQVLPLFLLPGMHVREDIPKEVALAQESLGDAVAIAQRPHVGAHPNLARQLTSHWATPDADAKILLSHGTRRTGGNEPVEAVAEQLGAVAAYWSVQPRLEEQIQVLASAGHDKIAILPYFLFSGGITDAIAQRVAELQAEFASVQLNLNEPIGASPELATLIVDLIEQQ